MDQVSSITLNIAAAMPEYEQIKSTRTIRARISHMRTDVLVILAHCAITMIGMICSMKRAGLHRAVSSENIAIYACFEIVFRVCDDFMRELITPRITRGRARASCDAIIRELALCQKYWVSTSPGLGPESIFTYCIKREAIRASVLRATVIIAISVYKSSLVIIPIIAVFTYGCYLLCVNARTNYKENVSPVMKKCGILEHQFYDDILSWRIPALHRLEIARASESAIRWIGDVRNMLPWFAAPVGIELFIAIHGWWQVTSADGNYNRTIVLAGAIIPLVYTLTRLGNAYSEYVTECEHTITSLELVRTKLSPEPVDLGSFACLEIKHLDYANTDESGRSFHLRADRHITLTNTRENVIIGKSASGKTTLIGFLTDHVMHEGIRAFTARVLDGARIECGQAVTSISRVTEYLTIEKAQWPFVRIPIYEWLDGKRETVDALLASFGLHSLSATTLIGARSRVSEGQARRLALIRALMHISATTRLLVMDEPESGLDKATCLEMVAGLRAFLAAMHNPPILVVAANGTDLIEAMNRNGAQILRITREGNNSTIA